MKEAVAYILDVFHILASIFLAIGGYILPTRYIPVFLLCTPYLVIDWNDTDTACWITKLRNMIRYESIHPRVDNEIQDKFIYGLVHRRLGITIEYNTFTFILYIVLFASWLYAYCRLMKKYNIKLFPNTIVKYTVYILILSWAVVTLPSLY